MLKLYPFLLTICFILIRNSLFAFDVENHSSQDSIEIGKFIDYLVDNHQINKNESGKLILDDIPNGFLSTIKIEISGSGDNPWFHFNNTVHFEFIRNNELMFNGYVIWDHVLFNAQDYFFYRYPEYRSDGLDKHYKAILTKHFADTLVMDTIVSHFVNNSRGQSIGDFRLEFKTLAFHGCMVDDNYSLIEENTYLEMPGGLIDFEPVFVFYSAAPNEYTDPNRYFGTEFRMYNKRYNLIHKGIISEVSMASIGE